MVTKNIAWTVKLSKQSFNLPEKDTRHRFFGLKSSQLASSHCTPVAPARCDQMVGLFLDIWPFTIVKTSPIMSQICQSQLRILPNMKSAVKNLPKRRNIWSHWSPVHHVTVVTCSRSSATRRCHSSGSWPTSAVSSASPWDAAWD